MEKGNGAIRSLPLFCGRRRFTDELGTADKSIEGRARAVRDASCSPRSLSHLKRATCWSCGITGGFPRGFQ